MSEAKGLAGVVAFEEELNSFVSEYLKSLGYEKALNSFNEECTNRGKAIGDLKDTKVNVKMADVQVQFMTCFSLGQRDNFFKLWQKYFTLHDQRHDVVISRLTFYLQIYFATFLHRQEDEQKNSEREERIMHFKRFLETSGATLSQTTEFLPYYALPFVPNPQSHAAYKDLFSSVWVSNLQLRLEKCLTLTLKSHDQPRLFDLYRGFNISCEADKQATMLKNDLIEAKQHLEIYQKRFRKVQADYHNLIGISAELVDTLENTIRGKMVTPEYLQQICIRLIQNQTGNTQLAQSSQLDFSRPGTAGAVLRQTICTSPQVQLEKFRGGNEHTDLDYEKIKLDLLSGDGKTKAILLQALRWLLTKATDFTKRDAVMLAFVKEDILQCNRSVSSKGESNIAVLLVSHADTTVRQYAARLLNTFASLSAGRTYLSQNADLLPVLIKVLKLEVKSSLSHENVLGTLQKMSLKRPLQLTMIQHDLVNWLIETLMDYDQLSDYSLEYSVALLMNLCLRTAGKYKSRENPELVLQVLSNLLDHENMEIRPYVNGALYSLLSEPSIRAQAKAMDMQGVLECFLKDDQPDFNRQIEYILKQLNSSDPMSTSTSDTEDDEGDEEDCDTLETDLDKNEILEVSRGELQGSQLLNAKYSLHPVITNTGSANKKNLKADRLQFEPILARPSTPCRSSVHLSGSISAAVITERPATRTGSRPSSVAGQNDNRPLSQQKNCSEMNGNHRAENSDSTHHEKDAFTSRPLVPRTPYSRGLSNDTGFPIKTPDNGVRPSSRGSVGSGVPLPRRSDSSPLSRPNSSEGQRSAR